LAIDGAALRSAMISALQTIVILLMAALPETMKPA